MASELSALLHEIEAAAVRGWPALETAAVDGWLWRHSAGGSVRANSVAALAFTGNDIDTAIDTVEAHARRRATPACFTISTLSAPSDIDSRLAARGYQRGSDHVTMAKPVDPHVPFPDGMLVHLHPQPDWLAVYLAGLSENRRATAPLILARLPVSASFLSAQIAQRTVSSGLTIGDGQVASVQCMATLLADRRRGGAQRVLQAIEHLAGRAGQTALYLQASGDNDAALELYGRAGFSNIGRYHTRTKVV